MLSGGTDKVKTSLSSTGIRDTTTLPIVNCLLEMGKHLRKREASKATMSEDQIQAMLSKKLEEQLRKSGINPLIGMPGIFSLNVVVTTLICCLGVNIHLDMPTEILHTILLGIVKYFWGQTVFILNKAHLMPTFQARLASINADGLNAPNLNADYICRYKGGLIGKHMKSLAQVMPFLIFDLVPQTVLNGWTAIGDLVILLWHTKIENTEEYLVCHKPIWLRS